MACTVGRCKICAGPYRVRAKSAAGEKLSALAAQTSMLAKRKFAFRDFAMDMPRWSQRTRYKVQQFYLVRLQVR
jgi:hypothetical protein